ncbi:MAG: putative sulfate exporter family transporter, partial [Clostridiaceae bacterium]|nr:putative sulfate exporter family transporter [Clostridiaceae bacterium]
MNWIKENYPGIVLSLLLAFVASMLGNMLPIVGGPVFGIMLGLIINNTLGKPDVTLKGIMFTSKKILTYAIVVLGAGLSLTQVLKTGLSSFSVTI